MLVSPPVFGQTLKVPFVSISPNPAPLWIAKEAGLFKKHNLDVELIYIPGGTASLVSTVYMTVVPAKRAGVKRIVLATPRPEPVAEPEEVFLPDRVQHFGHRALDHLVLHRGNAERA